MTVEKEVIISFVIATISSFCNAVLTGYDTNSQDITAIREFGCRWYGGSSSRVSCTCTDGSEMFIQRRSIPAYSTTEVEINGCKTVRFGENSVAEMRNLRHINLTNIESLIFDEESISWYGYRDAGVAHEERFDVMVPSLKIAISNSNVTLISSHSFRGRINEIALSGVAIERIMPLGFANLLQTETVTIKDSVIKNVDVQAFKKFSTENLKLEGVVMQFVPSRTFSDITVYQKFAIDKSSFDTVRSGAFSIYNPKIFEVTNTRIGQLDGEAFKVVSRGVVLFKNNTFNVVNDGAFQGITLKKDEVLSDAIFTFDSNIFSKLTRYSLSLSEPDFRTKFINLYINETCDCTSIDHKIKESEYYGDIKCFYDNEFVVVRDYKSDKCSVISNYYIVIIIVCIVTVLIVAIITALVLYYKLVYKRKQYGNEKQSKKGNLSLIVPDGRTYRETELHVIVERSDLLTTDL